MTLGSKNSKASGWNSWTLRLQLDYARPPLLDLCNRYLWNSFQILQDLCCHLLTYLKRFRPVKQKEIKAENFYLRSCMYTFVRLCQKASATEFQPITKSLWNSTTYFVIGWKRFSFVLFYSRWLMFLMTLQFSDIEFILPHLLWQLIHWLGVFETPMGVWEQIGVSWSRLFHPFLIHPVTKSIN